MNSLAVRLLTALTLSLGASSCLHIPLASPEDDARAKTFETDPNRCGLYVYRNGTAGSSTELQLELDGVEFGATGPRNFLFAWLTPGSHVLRSRTDLDRELPLDAKPGTLVFVRQELELGYWQLESKLQLVSEADGQRGVRECALVAPD